MLLRSYITLISYDDAILLAFTNVDAANSLTEKGFTKEHKENTSAIVRSINDSICRSISQSRSFPESFNKRMWESIYNYGSLTAANAKEIGIVDSLPVVDPLDSLLQANKSDDALKEAKEKLGKTIDLSSFRGTKAVSLQEYRSNIVKRKRAEERKWKTHEKLKYLAEKSGATRQILSLLQYNAPNYNIEMVSIQQCEALFHFIFICILTAISISLYGRTLLRTNTTQANIERRKRKSQSFMLLAVL